jgi:hypothetical protein
MVQTKMLLSLTFGRHLATVFGVLLALTICLASEGRAQEKYNLQLPAPPPMKLLSRDERAQLSAARDPKARTRLSIELAEARLTRAEQLTSGQQYASAAAELGSYQGLVEDAINYLISLKSTKLRDIFKRLELALRMHGTRLESMRRTTPSEYAFNIKAIAEYTKQARTDALNAFYGDTVLRPSEKDENVNAETPSAKPSSVPQKEQP